MKQFTIKANEYLSRNIKGFYNMDYVGYGKDGNPDFLNVLKNDFNNKSEQVLKNNAKKLYHIVKNDLLNFNRNLTICVVPRSKSLNRYSQNQLYFKRAIKYIANELGFIDGSDYIIRNKDTKTTHMTHSFKGMEYAGDGNSPYPGITKDTCNISDEVKGKDILLIDDIYTFSVNIDEDAIEALLQNGANSVIFYSVAKTLYKGY